MFRAIVFAVVDCGYQPRCALEAIDGGDVRLQKIERIIEESKFGIHDLSNMSLDPITHLPRFNMPLELGLFLGAKRYGEGGQREKRLIILDSEEFRYRKAISDISGQDIDCHNGNTDEAIARVRNWLSTVSKRKTIPGPKHIQDRYNQYTADLPAICRNLKYDSDDLTFNGLWETMVEWQRANAEI